jgi:PAS domain S-box-containing protein
VTNIDNITSDLLAAGLARWFEELSDSGIFTTDASLIIRSWNRWLEAQTGIPAAKAVGTGLYALFPGLKDRGLDEYYQDALGGEVRVLSERLHRYLIPINRSGSAGFEMAQSARIAPLSVGGRVAGTITVLEDVSERVASERELRSQIAVAERARLAAEDASKLKDEFLATLSHEIRTPLNAVLGWVRILRTQPKNKSRDRGLEVIERNAISQLRLVEDLLDMARVISGKLRLDVAVIQLETVAQAAMEVVAPAAAAKRITVHPAFAPDLPPVTGDADRLQQAIWNLLSNAIKFTARDGRVDVNVTQADGSVVLTVCDTGQGIARDFLPYVFDRFRQQDASAARREGGLGLGLALVRQIAELHGGTVSAHSDGENKGARFSIVLPAAKNVGPQDRPPQQPDALPVRLAGVSVLIVDDHDDGREMLRVGLQGYGARVQAVRSGAAALETLSTDRAVPDVIVCDIAMPDMDGYALIRRIRSSKNAAVRRIAAIAATAYAEHEDRIRALAAGYQLYLAKPINPSALAASIQQLAAPSSREDRER